jgi:hypothetical protein
VAVAVVTEKTEPETAELQLEVLAAAPRVVEQTRPRR